MKIRVLISLVIAILSLSGFLKAQTKVFYEAKGSGTYQTSYDFDKWNFSVGKVRFEIKKNGKAKRIKTKNRLTNFHIKLDKGEELKRVIYFFPYKNDLLLICEVSWEDAGSGFIVRLDGKTLKTKWKAQIPAFNVSKGLIEGKMAYLAAIGFAAKINLENGKFIWKHADFYRKYDEDGAFNIFEVPEIKGKVVTYTENQDDYDRPPNIIKFNKNSGKIIEVKIN